MCVCVGHTIATCKGIYWPTSDSRVGFEFLHESIERDTVCI